MSESAARDMRNQGPAIDLEEFERRLRAPEPTRRGEDPMAELARLVGSANDPFRDVFAAPQERQAALPQAGDYQLPAVQAHEINPETAPHVLRNVAEQMRAPSGDFAPPPPPVYQDLAQPQAYQEEWRENIATSAHPQQPDPYTAAAPQEQWEQPPAARQDFRPPPPPASLAQDDGERRTMSRKSMLYMGSALAVVIVGIGATLATSGKMRSGNVPTIAASKEPVKVKPEGEDATAPRAVRNVSVLDKTVGTKPAQPTVVSREEQPVDLSQVQAQPRGARVPDSDINRIVNLNSSDVTKPVASVAPQAGSAPQAAGYFPEPRKVRTVAVRPDGSVVVAPPASPQTAPRVPAVPALAATAPTVRPPATPAPAPRAAASAPGPEKATARAARPQPAAEEPDTAPVATTRAAPARQAPAAERPAQTPQRVAAVAPPATPTATPAASTAGGGFAVQLAAPGTEAEAKSTVLRLRQRFATELGGRSPTVRAASVGDKTVYRVRIGGLSREDATALCSKLQGKGGACFVAKN